jgi:hypothetical protein
VSQSQVTVTPIDCVNVSCWHGILDLFSRFHWWNILPHLTNATTKDRRPSAVMFARMHPTTSYPIGFVERYLVCTSSADSALAADYPGCYSTSDEQTTCSYTSIPLYKVAKIATKPDLTVITVTVNVWVD